MREYGRLWVGAGMGDLVGTFTQPQVVHVMVCQDDVYVQLTGKWLYLCAE